MEEKEEQDAEEEEEARRMYKEGRRRWRVLSRGGIAEEVQTRLHLHNRYIPAAWTGAEAETERVLGTLYRSARPRARWQSLKISFVEGKRGGWKIRKETEKNEGTAGGGCGALSTLRT